MFGTALKRTGKVNRGGLTYLMTGQNAASERDLLNLPVCVSYEILSDQILHPNI